MRFSMGAVSEKLLLHNHTSQFTVFHQFLIVASSSFLLKRSYSSPGKEVVIALLARVNQFVGRDALRLFPLGTICFTIQPQYASLDTLHAKSVTSDFLFCVFPPSGVPSSHTLSMAKSESV